MLLSERKHHPTANTWPSDCERTPSGSISGELTFYFLPADLVGQVLNFGLPAPIDIQILGANLEANRRSRINCWNKFAHSGSCRLTDPAAGQSAQILVDLDRTKAQDGGLIAQKISPECSRVALSGSFQTSPTFWLNPRNGVSYSVATQSPQYQMSSLSDLRNIPMSGTNIAPQILANVASSSRGAGYAEVAHWNIIPVIDIYGTVQGADLGTRSRAIEAWMRKTPRALCAVPRWS